MKHELHNFLQEIFRNSSCHLSAISNAAQNVAQIADSYLVNSSQVTFRFHFPFRFRSRQCLSLSVSCLVPRPQHYASGIRFGSRGPGRKSEK